MIRICVPIHGVIPNGEYKGLHIKPTLVVCHASRPQDAAQRIECILAGLLD